MSPAAPDQAVLDEAADDAYRAAVEFDGARAWLDAARRHPMEPLGAEVWVTDSGFRYVLLVRHRIRGWVPPGGMVEPGESPRAAAARELLEETGLRVELLARPAAVAVRSYGPELSETLGLSYAAVADRETPLVGEPGQPAAWFSLDAAWESVFADDRDRIRTHAHRLRAARGPR